MRRIREADFYLDRPTMVGWRGVSLLVPAIASAVGFFAFAVLGFGFTELNTLSPLFRTALVLVGAFALAFGGEVGTLSNTVEIFRKNGRAGRWDWTALVMSVLSTLAAFILAFAALLGVRAQWTGWVQMYGPILLGVLAALDSYGGFMEFGLYLNSYDERMREWMSAFEQFKRSEYEREQSNVQPSVLNAAPFVQPPVRSFTPDEQADEKARRKAKLAQLYRDDPELPVTVAAEAVGVGRTTAYAYLAELERDGLVRRDGRGERA